MLEYLCYITQGLMLGSVIFLVATTIEAMIITIKNRRP